MNILSYLIVLLANTFIKAVAIFFCWNYALIHIFTILNPITIHQMFWIYVTMCVLLSKFSFKYKKTDNKEVKVKPTIIVEPRAGVYQLADFYIAPEGKWIGTCKYNGSTKDWELSICSYNELGHQISHPAAARYYSRLSMINGLAKYFKFEGDTRAKLDSLLPSSEKE